MKGVVKRLSLSLLLGFCCSVAYSQNSLITQKKFEFKKPLMLLKSDTTAYQQSIKMPQVYSFDKLAIFCKFEERVARNSNVNMRFRLGSLDYVNYLEQKPNWQLSKSNTQ